VSLAENKGIWFGVSGLALIVAWIVWLLAGAQPFRLVVLFEDAGGLEKEDPVLWKDFTIGRVEEIRPLVENKIGVTIRIREEYAANISRGSQFSLKRSAWMGLVGRDAIEVTTPETPGPPFSPGERVPGISVPKSSMLEDGKELGFQYWNQLKEETSRLLEEYRNSPFRGELEQTSRQLQQLAAEGATEAVKEAGSFTKSHRKEIEAVLESMKHLKDRLLQAGDPTGARKMETQIEKLQEGIRP